MSNEPDNDVTRIQNRIVAVIVILGTIGFAIIFALAQAQKNEEPEQYGCVYDPRDGSSTCLQE